MRYVNNYDQNYQGASFDAIVCDVDKFHSVNKQYGRQFGDYVLHSIGNSLNKLIHKIGGIGCRKGGDTFLLYCPHQEEYEQLLKEFLDELYEDKEIAGKVALRFGIFINAQQEPDIEERFVRAQNAADSIKDDPKTICGFYEM